MKLMKRILSLTAVLGIFASGAYADYYRCMTSDFNDNWSDDYTPEKGGVGIRVLVFPRSDGSLKLNEVVTLPGSLVETGGAGRIPAEIIGDCQEIERGKCRFILNLAPTHGALLEIPTDIDAGSTVTLIDQGSRSAKSYALTCRKDD